MSGALIGSGALTIVSGSILTGFVLIFSFGLDIAVFLGAALLSSAMFVYKY
jgi:hypothetical protein